MKIGIVNTASKVQTKREQYSEPAFTASSKSLNALNKVLNDVYSGKMTDSKARKILTKMLSGSIQGISPPLAANSMVRVAKHTDLSNRISKDKNLRRKIRF